MDYLKSKMVKSDSLSSEEEEESEDEAVSCTAGSEAEEEAAQQDGPELGPPSGNKPPGVARAEVCA